MADGAPSESAVASSRRAARVTAITLATAYLRPTIGALLAGSAMTGAKFALLGWIVAGPAALA